MPTKKKVAKKGKTKPATERKAKIGKNMALGELVAKHPETINVMFKYGLHCVGCHMAAHETIEQGAMAHGMDSKAIERMLKEMNAAIGE